MKLKILSFNIHKGFNWSNTQATLEQLKLFLEKTDCDIIFLQEVVGQNLKNEKKYSQIMSEQFEYLADSLWSDFAYAKNAVYDGRHHGNATLSKFPIISQKQVDISTNRFEQRGILFCELEINNKIVHTYNVHLNLTHAGRKKQYQAIANQIQINKSQEKACIIAGDFNDWNKKATELLDLDFLDAYKKLHHDYPKTFPSFLPLFSLDRIYTHNMEITHAEVLNCKQSSKLSDHLSICINGEI